MGGNGGIILHDQMGVAVTIEGESCTVNDDIIGPGVGKDIEMGTGRRRDRKMRRIGEEQ
jgi:hypothetical protein